MGITQLISSSDTACQESELVSGARPPYNVCYGSPCCDPGFYCMPADHSSNSFCMRNDIGEGDDCGADAALVGNNTYNINLLLILFSSIILATATMLWASLV